MAKIYKITNTINGKSYVGKTEKTIEERFKEHLRESKKERFGHRPIYRAIKKYGEENFKIELLEETKDPEEREIYYIRHFDTFNNQKGYNATIGGDGKKWLDYNAIIECYKNEQNTIKVAEIMGCHYDTVRDILNANNIKIKGGAAIAKEELSQKVEQYDLHDNYIQTFNSYKEAANWVKDNCDINTKEIEYIRQHISRTARGQINRKSAYKYKWKII